MADQEVESLLTAFFTADDQTLPEVLRKSSGVLVVDHRSEENEVTDEIARLLTGFTATHRYSEEGDLLLTMHFNFRGRNLEKIYQMVPYNCFRVVLDVHVFLQPDAGIRAWDASMQSDTHVFVVAEKAFWDRFDREASPARKKILQPVQFLDEAWELSGPRPVPVWKLLLMGVTWVLWTVLWRPIRWINWGKLRKAWKRWRWWVLWKLGMWK